jgi:hypothetical protein
MPRAMLALPMFLAACEFEGDENTAPIEMNTCTTSAACESGSACRDSLCVADAADEQLKIALQVTPTQTIDGEPPLPILIPPFSVAKPTERQFDLAGIVQFSGQVRDKMGPKGIPIDAKVTFMPTDVIPGIPVLPVAVSVTQSSIASEDGEDFHVQLLSGVSYRMNVEPTEMRLPPYTDTFVAGDVGKRSVYFDQLISHEQAISITGDAADRDLLVTAFNQDTGEPVSSTGVATKGKATLVFANGSETLPFWLQVRAVQTFDAEPSMNAMQCDSDTPVFPSFAIDGSDVYMPEEGAWKIELPKLPERIRYEGTVELCPDERARTASITALPVTLHSRSIALDGETPMRASFHATTSATYDDQAQALRFCVQVMQGEYDILATPPPGMRCSLFAQRIEIKVPAEHDAVEGHLLSLPAAAYLTGKLLTSAAMPLSSASVEAHALGAFGETESLELPADDRSVTRYNRSSDTVTDAGGNFKLPVDLGSYDVVAKPLAESGFPWRVRTNVGAGIGLRKAPISKTFDMLTPVVVKGSLRYPRRGEAAQATLGGAEIAAFALIPSDSGERAVAIGKAMADANGRFTLLLPQSIETGW